VISSYLDPSKRVSNLRTYFIYCFSARNMNQHCQCTHLRRTSNEIYIYVKMQTLITAVRLKAMTNYS